MITNLITLLALGIICLSIYVIIAGIGDIISFFKNH